MKTSGLVLDIFDDSEGEVLRSIYPALSDIPETVKTAHVLTTEERSTLPDDVFALVLLNEGEKFRKYACIDQGNTTLSIEFFLKTASKLPSEAQKVAAENLLTACSWYGIQPPEQLQKLAAGLGTLINALPAISVASQVPGQIHQNLEENKILGGGGRIVTPDEREMVRQMGKQAAASLGGQDPTSTPAQVTGASPTPSKTTILKSAGDDPDGEKAAAEMHHLIVGEHAHHGGEESVPPDDNIQSVKGEIFKSEPQGKMFRPHVDVSNKEPTRMLKEKKAERYALPSKNRYPLDSYSHVELASQYFDKYASAFTPDERREYCLNLVPRADELGIKVADEARQYAAVEWGTDEKTAFGYTMRRQACGDIADFADTLDLLYEKKAEIDPELFAATLAEFDKLAGLDHEYDRSIPDPYASVFGVKIAEEWSESIGNDYVTEQDLRRLAKIGMRALKSTFDEEFAHEFRKDPVAIFKSLPLDQKRIVMRMANDNTGPGIELTG
jgi:hypothetical protein